jgi:alpha-amylase
MYFMVDVVVNNVMSTSVNLTDSILDTFYFKQPNQYHPYCSVDWSNLTSEQQCWLGDTTVPLPDLNTEDSTVQSGYAQLIQQLVQEYDIDGLRIDGEC